MGEPPVLLCAAGDVTPESQRVSRCSWRTDSCCSYMCTLHGLSGGLYTFKLTCNRNFLRS
ncbi:hypothetical protein MAR_025269 [Mya arenaria]|uniref:Uncharacterized protein n=1 Tax=Mya arenaria TaxID=6604 RepID=A0ABY7DWB0_MYAAR|nr:hypothetical protein MAR_025269 [Mya arenaria]